MKKIMLCSLCVLIGMAAAAQKAVAVYVTCDEESKNYKEEIYHIFVNAFVSSSDFKVMEKSEAMLEEMNRELGFQREGTVNSEEVVKMGHQLGVQCLCVVEVKTEKKYGYNTYNIYKVYVHLNNLEKAEILRTNRAEFVNTPKDLMGTAYQIANMDNNEVIKEDREERRLDYHQFKSEIHLNNKMPPKPFECLNKDYKTAEQYFNRYKRSRYAGNALLWTGFGLAMADLVAWGTIGIVSLTTYYPDFRDVEVQISLLGTSILVAAPLVIGGIIRVFSPVSLRKSYKYFSKVRGCDVSVTAVPFAAPESAGLGVVVKF